MMDVAEASSNVFFDGASTRRLAGVYAPCFTMVVQLRAARELGASDVLRQRVKDLLGEAEREAARAGVAPEDLQMARFALVAFVDETLLLSDWSQRDRWAAQPLQLELYDRYDAGEAFFDRLAHLRQQPTARAEVIEVYYLCLALGFKGKYQLHEQEKRRILIEETFDELRRVPGLAPGALAPHGTPRDQAAAEVRSKLPAWAMVVFAAGVALLLYVGMSLYMSQSADRAAQAIERVPRVTLAP